jgi:anti-sigma factor RsiW
MNAHDEDRMKRLLQRAVPPVGEREPDRDLWPAVLRRMDQKPTRTMLFRLPLIDWVLLAGLAAFAAFFPVSIPLLLYCF